MNDLHEWPKSTLRGWKDFLDRTHEVSGYGERTILYRGQAGQWALKPRLLRSLSPSADQSFTMQLERKLLEHFKSLAHLHGATAHFPSHARPGLFDWWGLMQHYGAPTRLLDWTASPQVAAYFAVEKEMDRDGEIIVIDAEVLKNAFPYGRDGREIDENVWTNYVEIDGVQVMTPMYKTGRLAVQQGYFSLALQSTTVQDDLIIRSGAALGRWTVPSGQKRAFMRELSIMNVSAQALFPGLDGLGRSTGDLVQVLLAGITDFGAA